MNHSRWTAIAEQLAAYGGPPYRLEQIRSAIYSSSTLTYSSMTFLPRTLRYALAESLGDSVLSLEPVTGQSAEQATKVLFRLQDGRTIETVRMRYRKGQIALCISSQVGCALGCAFCATATAGLQRNLTVDEITDQVLYFQKRGDKISSVSFMGMGEPLVNPNTFKALAALRDPQRLNLGLRRISLSTVGIVPGLERMTETFPQVNLSFSLHSAFSEQRRELMPITRTYAPQDVLAQLDHYLQRTHRKVFIAYLLITGYNDTPHHAQALTELLRGRHAYDHLYHVNLLRYNPARGVLSKFRTDDATLRRFKEWLEQDGLSVTVRQSFGASIDAACGQLYASQQQLKDLSLVPL